MTQLEISLKIVEAYTILLKLVTKNAEYAKTGLSYSIKKISERETTQLNDENSNVESLPANDCGELDLVFASILQAVVEKYNDMDSIYKLAKSYRQALSILIFNKRTMPSTISILFERTIGMDTISDDFRLLIENLRRILYL